ncbi:metallophosphoesterase [Dyadobacter sp. CY326]|uniref:metallophosphoesterase n=1 Tax=Dyadobacter sp. CY326 TaxID=2907300 RepID=UPI001F209984|nr:metallophosphoesterase [Dyadobacter sp. CY326]MCE7065922.1 metallophosphoesterase [Dyadobacter sp. CY326]
MNTLLMNLKASLFFAAVCIFALTFDAAGHCVSAKTAFIPTLLRGPYLQSATSQSIVIRWRTSEPSDSRVKFGNAANALTNTVDNGALITDHEVKLTGLQPATRYYYSVGTSSLLLQGNADNFFETAPAIGVVAKYRIGVFGDCGNNSANQVNVRNQMQNYLGKNYMNAWILLGDNAYNSGTDAEYQSGFFNIYKDKFLKQNPLFPCPGNHDYANSQVRQNDHAVPYYDMFTIPKSGEAGGIATGTEAYYSFDYGNMHFLSLDSYGKEDNATRLYDTLGKQVSWIKQDLAANANKDWVVAYWHHPPYTKGSHDSDSESELVKIRENFIRILERNGVDLILCGHSHDYERSKLMKGHYGLESAFDATANHLSKSSGKYDGSAESCPYIKKSVKNEGTVYVVAGSAGQLGGTQAGYPHNALPFANASQGGAMILEVEGNRLDARWVTSTGAIMDQFTMEKDVSKRQAVTVQKGSSVTLTASYIGVYTWSTGASTRAISVSPMVDTDYIVQDQYGCVSDTFNVKSAPALPVKLVSFHGHWQENANAVLDWETAMEENADYFSVERSFSGQNFQEAGRVAAAGNAAQTSQYKWTDQSISKSNIDVVYYRLKQVDRDGTFVYSKIIALTNANVTDDDFVEIIPNPSNAQDMKIRLSDGKGVQSELILSNVSGKILNRSQMTLTNIPNSFLPARLAPGIYFLKVNLNGKSIVKKLMIH